MYEAIFNGAPSDAAGALTYLQEWKPILNVVLGDLKVALAKLQLSDKIEPASRVQVQAK